MSISIRIVFFTFATYPSTIGHSLKLALPDSRINACSHSFAVRNVTTSLGKLFHTGIILSQNYTSME